MSELINEAWKSNPRLMVVVISFFVSLLLMILKSNYDKYIEFNDTIKSSKIFLSSYANILISSILNDDKELAKDHYKILLNSLSVLKKDTQLNENFQKLQNFYISLQIGNYDNNSDKKGKDIAQIEALLTKLK